MVSVVCFVVGVDDGLAEFGASAGGEDEVKHEEDAGLEQLARCIAAEALGCAQEQPQEDEESKVQRHR
jgi:hypothetical protein